MSSGGWSPGGRSPGGRSPGGLIAASRVAVVVLVALGATPARATSQDAEHEVRAGITTEVFAPEDRQTRDFSVYTVAVELERHLTEGLWLRGSLGPMLIRQDPSDSFGVLEDDRSILGLRSGASLRYHFVRRGGWAPYMEAGAGTLFTSERFPPEGTWWNFSYRLGFGLEFALGDSARVGVGFRHVHFSNGKRQRGENPAYNGNGLAVGVTW